MQVYKTVLLLVVAFLPFTNAYPTTPDNSWIYTGQSYMTRWDFNQAIFYFSKAIEDNPNHTKAYLYRSKAYLMINRYHEAMDDYQKTLAIDPKYVKNFMGKKRLEKNNSRHFANPGLHPIPN